MRESLLRAAAPAAFYLFFIPAAIAGENPAAAIALPGSFRNTFQKNEGQWNPQVLYRGAANGILVSFLKDGVSFLISRETEEVYVVTAGRPRHEYLVWNLKFENANDDAEALAPSSVRGRQSYFIGNDPSKWAPNVHESNEVFYKNIYTSIDLLYYYTQNSLKYDFILRPGADVRNIRMKYDGIRSMALDEEGRLVIETLWGEKLYEVPPYAYQEDDGQAHAIPIEYVLLDEFTFGFEVKGEYDPDRDLVIDPFTIVWGSYSGATNANYENYAFNVTADASGNSYIMGKGDNSYPVTSGTYAGGMNDVFVSKFSSNGTSMVYSIYLGGGSMDNGTALTVNSAGEVFVTGTTYSTNFPVTAGAYQTVLTQDTVDCDPFDCFSMLCDDNTLCKSYTYLESAFVTKINSAGNGLSYSTYLSGNGGDAGYGIAVNGAGEAVVTGQTSSSNFPVSAGAYRTSINGTTDIFIARMSVSGNSVPAATYFGGSSGETAYDVVLNASGEAFITGVVYSTNFPVSSGAFRTAGGSSQDAFAARFNANYTSLTYSTFLPGSAIDEGYDIAVNGSNQAYVTGYTSSSNFPVTSGSYQTVKSTGFDAFVVKLNSGGTAAMYSTFIGGTGFERAKGIVVNAAGEAYVSLQTGSTLSTSAGAPQPSPLGSTDLYVIHLNAAGNGLGCGGATYVGGNDADYEDPEIGYYNPGGVPDRVVIIGTTHSTNFPTTAGVYRPTKVNGGGDQPALIMLESCTPPLPTGFLAFSAGLSGRSVQVEWSVTEDGRTDRFEIERREPAGQYARIGAVTGSQGLGVENYSFTDASLPDGAGVLYYRLKKIDYDGGNTCTGEEAVYLHDAPGQFSVTPVDDRKHIIRLEAYDNPELELTVYDSKGRTVRHQKHLLQGGPQSFILDLEDQSSGMYFLDARMGEERHVVKLMME